MPVSPWDPTLMSQFQHLLSVCDVEISGGVDGWEITIKRHGGGMSIRVGNSDFAFAAAQAVNRAEEMGLCAASPELPL